VRKAFVDTNVLLRLLVGDDAAQHRASVALLQRARREGFAFRVLPVALLEVVWVLERIYRYPRSDIREIVEAILNTPEFEVESESAFRKALPAYESTGIKFADALMAHWGIELGLTTAYTFDEKDFRRIPGLDVRKP
jgi:predicted nucleic-acid-binding protein